MQKELATCQRPTNPLQVSQEALTIQTHSL